MKAEIPIMGGVNVPAVEAQTSTAPATCGSTPALFMAGIVTAPVVKTLTIGWPLIDANIALANTATLAVPPLMRPTNASARFRKNSPPPVSTTTMPNTIKPSTTSIYVLNRSPMALCTLSMWNIAVTSKGRPTPSNNPGICAAING